MDWLIAEFKKDQGIDVSKDKMVLQRLKEAAEKAKIELSSVQETEINLPFLTADATGPKHLQIKLSRAKLEQMIGPLVDRAKEPTKKALAGRGQDAGGDRRGRARRRLDPHPDGPEAGEGVLRQGAAQGRQPRRGRGARRGGPGRRALGRGQGHPAPRRHAADARHRDARRRDDADDPAQHHHPDQEDRDLLDGGRRSDLGRGRGHAGRAPDGARQPLLGRFHLDGIPPAPRGVPQIEVTFDIDANGIVNVHAKDKGTGKEQKITITASSGLTEAEIQKMVKDAEAHEAEDKKRKEAIEARNQLDSLVFQMEKMLAENRDKIDEAARAEVETRHRERQEGARGEQGRGKDAAPFKTAFDELQKASYKMAEQMYKQAAAADGRRRRRGARPPAPSRRRRSRRTSSTPSSKSSPSSKGRLSAVDPRYEQPKL